MDSTPATARRHAARLLLAEDDGEMRALLTRALRASHHEVVECANGLELLRAIDPEQSAQGACDFDLIISDIRMPGITGLSLLEGLRHWPGLPPVDMILITAFGDPETHARARELGALALIDKPFEIEVLMARVREALAAERPPTASQGDTR